MERNVNFKTNSGRRAYCIRLIHDELALLAASDFAAILAARDAMEKTIDSLAGENEQLHYAAGQAAEQEQSLAQDVAQAARALQFGDAVRRRLDHVVQTLIMTEKAFYLRSAGMHRADDKKVEMQEDWIARLAKIYTRGMKTWVSA